MTYSLMCDLNQLNLLIKVHQERKQKAEQLSATVAKLTTNTEQLADLLDEDMPVLAEEEKKEEDEEETEMAQEVEESALGPIWEDEETKSLYENLVDLKAFIPAILYKESASSEVKGLPDEKGEDDGDEEVLVVPEEEEEGDVAPPNLEGNN